MYSPYKLNKQGVSIQPWCTALPILNQSIVPCLVLTCFLACIQISQETGKVVWYSSKNFPQFVVIHTIRGFGIVSEADVDVFLEFSCFLYGPVNVVNLISGSSDFSNSSLYIWKFSVHVLLKPSLKDFEHYLASMWNERNCVVIWIFFVIVLLWDGMKTDLSSPVATAECHCSTLIKSSFRNWNSSAGIPSPSFVCTNAS